jgi:hypothetical protein
VSVILVLWVPIVRAYPNCSGWLLIIIYLNNKMLKHISSIQQKNVRLEFFNPISTQVYCLDSINLIIGDNGSGKTNLIRGIIGELASGHDGVDYVIEGDLNNLGVVYYTAAPFHKPIRIRNSASIQFLDASPLSLKKQRFLEAAREYVNVSQMLKLNIPMKSTYSVDLAHTASRLITSLYRTGANRKELTEELNHLIFDLKNLSEIVSAQDTAKKLRDKDALSAQEEKLLKFGERYSKIDVTESRTKIRQQIVKKIINLLGPRNKISAVRWITAGILLSGNDPGKLRDYQLEYQYLIGDIEKMAPGAKKNWDRVFPVVSDFLKHIQKTKCGEFKYSRDAIELTIDFEKFLDSNAPESLAEKAAELGLIRIGFDSISSGEAAITHQLASISHAIRVLADGGQDKVVVFIDEGDLLLHLSWQRKYLELLDNRLSLIRSTLSLKSLQLVVASHSALLASDVLRSAITRLGPLTNAAGFGAPLQRIMNYSFGTPSIGAIAEKIIARLRAKRKLSKQDLEVIAEIDDDFIRDFLLGVRG